jgi:hypothetical protein
MYRTTVQAGETLFDIICRAGYEANQRGELSFSIDCDKCGQPVANHETPEDCDIWLKEFGYVS